MNSKHFNLPILFGLITVLLAWWVTALVIEPFLHYNFQQPAFLVDFNFLKGYLGYPGGMADYAALFIAQFFSFNVFGSLIIVLIAAIQGLLALNLVTRLTGNTRYGFAIFAINVIMGVLVMCDYRYLYLASIRLFMATAITWGYLVIIQKWHRWRYYFWPPMALALFYLAGGPALFVFALSTVMAMGYTDKSKTWMLTTAVFLVVAAIIPYLAHKWVFQQSLATLYSIVDLKPPEFIAYITLYLTYFFQALLPLVLFVFLFLIPGKPATELQKGKAVKKIKFHQKQPFILAAQFVILLALAYILFIRSHEPFKKKLLYLGYYAETGQWEQVLKVAETIQSYDFRVNYQVNRAYAHLNQLPERLFNYPQIEGAKGLFLNTSDLNGETLMPTSDLYFDLGLMSEAQRYAFEAQTLKPNSPRILKRLIMVNLINGKYKTAGQFLKVLDKNMLCQKWVQQYQKYVADTTLAGKDPLILQKRRFNSHQPFVHTSQIGGLEYIYAANRQNRFAYDFLLSYCLLDGNLPLFIKYLPHHTIFKLDKMPLSWEEALALYTVRTSPEIPLASVVSKSCMDRMIHFNGIIQKANGNLQTAKNRLQRDHGNSYWFYMLYMDPKLKPVAKN
jgi:hypothetical protein